MILEFTNDNIYKTVEELEGEIETLQAIINGKQSRIDYLKMETVYQKPKVCQTYEKRKVLYR